MDTITIKYSGENPLTTEVNSQPFSLKITQTPQNDTSINPKKLLLLALGGCTALDIESLIKKMRVEILGFDVVVCGDISKTKPHIYTKFHLCYRFNVEGIVRKETREKLKKIVEMSQERYCALSAMLRKVAPITYSVTINDHNIETCACR